MKNRDRKDILDWQEKKVDFMTIKGEEERDDGGDEDDKMQSQQYSQMMVQSKLEVIVNSRYFHFLYNIYITSNSSCIMISSDEQLFV